MNINWSDLIKRVCQVVSGELRNNNDGVAVVTIKFLMSTDNKPTWWVVNAKRIEPSNKAVELIDFLGN